MRSFATHAKKRDGAPHFQTLAKPLQNKGAALIAITRAWAQTAAPARAAMAVDARDLWDGSATLGEREMSEEGDSWRNEDDR